MSDGKDDSEATGSDVPGASRRDFLAASVAAGLTAAAGRAFAAQPSIVEQDVTIRTPDGTCDAAFFHPATGKHAAVLVWPDAFGLRPAMRDIGRRVAGEGYAVLVPNPYYRLSKSPQFMTGATFDFSNQAQMAQLQPLMGSLKDNAVVERDAAACVAFLDGRGEVDRAKKIGTQGYCMGGRLVVITAATVPDRIGAGASFHGGGLVTDKPDSPHLLAPRVKARMYFGVASNDDARQPDAKVKLKEAFARVPTEVEVYPAKHGWCVPDMPVENGTPIYDKAQAERAWGKLVALYKAGLA